MSTTSKITPDLERTCSTVGELRRLLSEFEDDVLVLIAVGPYDDQRPKIVPQAIGICGYLPEYLVDVAGAPVILCSEVLFRSADKIKLERLSV